ncbi:hypothetical protein CEXT_720751, partial [Caerostris extrusa]
TLFLFFVVFFPGVAPIPGKLLLRSGLKRRSFGHLQFKEWLQNLETPFKERTEQKEFRPFAIQRNPIFLLCCVLSWSGSKSWKLLLRSGLERRSFGHLQFKETLFFCFCCVLFLSGSKILETPLRSGLKRRSLAICNSKNDYWNDKAHFFDEVYNFNSSSIDVGFLFNKAKE